MPKPSAKDAAGCKDRWGAPSAPPTVILRGAAGRSLGHCQGGRARPRLGPRRPIPYPQVLASGHPHPVLKQPPCGVPDTGTRAAGPGHRRERREKTSGNTDEEPQRCSALPSRMRPELDGRVRGATPRPPPARPGPPLSSPGSPPPRTPALPASQSASAASPSYDERHSALCFLCFLPMATAPRAAASPAGPWPPPPNPGSPPASPRSL